MRKRNGYANDFFLSVQTPVTEQQRHHRHAHPSEAVAADRMARGMFPICSNPFDVSVEAERAERRRSACRSEEAHHP